MINKCIIIGCLTKDVELTSTSTGIFVAKFNIACDRPKGKEQEKITDFINCVAWRQTAEYLSKYAAKGSMIAVEGKIQTRNYEGQDGKRVYITEIVCDSVQVIEFKQSNKANNDIGTKQEKHGYEETALLDISSDDLPF